MKFSWSKELYIEWCSRKERHGTAWLLAGVWQLKWLRRNSHNGKCPLCLEEEDVKHILLDCSDSRNWRLHVLNDKWISINEEVAHKKMLICTNKNQLNLGKHLDIVMCKLFNKSKEF
jgi:hypothetical protein